MSGGTMQGGNAGSKGAISGPYTPAPGQMPPTTQSLPPAQAQPTQSPSQYGYSPADMGALMGHGYNPLQMLTQTGQGGAKGGVANPIMNAQPPQHTFLNSQLGQNFMQRNPL